MAKDWEAITFILPDYDKRMRGEHKNDYRRIVKTLSREVGRLKSGSPTIHDPTHFAAPAWLTIDKAIEIHNDIFHGAFEKLNQGSPEFSDRKTAVKFLWKKLLPKARPPQESDYGKQFLAKKFCLQPQVVPENVEDLSPNIKIGKTTKSPKSEKNIKRVSCYKGHTIKTILSENPGLTMSDIKYDVKHGFAKIFP